MVDILSTPILVTIILGTVALAIPLIDAMRKERGSHRSYGSIAFGALIVSIFVILFRILSGEEIPVISFVDSSVLTEDMFGSFFAVVMLIVAIMVTISSIEYMRKTPNPAPYYSLLLLSSIGMVLLSYSTDLLMLIVAWELMSIPTYVLAGFHKRDTVSNEAAIKYFLFGALSTGIIIYGISLAYGLTGSTNIAIVLQELVQIDGELRPVALMALAMFIAMPNDGDARCDVGWTLRARHRREGRDADDGARPSRPPPALSPDPDLPAAMAPAQGGHPEGAVPARRAVR